MGALRKEAAKPVIHAQPLNREVSAEDLFRRTQQRYAKVMTRLGE